MLVWLLPTLAVAASLANGSLLRPREESQMQAWDHGAVRGYPIHSSCNITERRLLQRGLDDAVTLAQHGREHALRFGNSSHLYRRYFGNEPTAQVIGNLDRIVKADKANTLFRCDDPDGNCQIPTYAGHWRGENGTAETVICPLSYTSRLLLEYFCMNGYTVAGSSLNTYFGSDLLHRLYHMPAIGEDHVQHFADTYDDVLELAKHNSTFAVRDSDALQYFAVDTYAFDIAVPGVGCSGNSTNDNTPDESSSQTSVTAPPPTETAEIPPNCHTHDGGELHCT